MGNSHTTLIDGGIKLQLITVDFDGTLFQGDSFNLMFQAGKKEFGIREWTAVAAGSLQALLLGIFKGKNALRIQFFKSFAKTFKGKTQDELTSFFHHLVEAGKADINIALVEMIQKEQENGNQVMILSGALTPFLHALTDKLGLDVTIVGTNLTFDSSGKCTGNTGVVVNGKEKVQAVTNWLQESGKEQTEIKVWAYADSESDIPLLQFVDEPIIVNPKDKMRKVAEANSWPIFGE